MHLVEAFRQGLQELGYVEGQNFALVIRSPEQGPEQLPDRAAELVRLQVDVIVTAAPQPIQAAQQAIRAIPIVMAGHADPVGAGVVASLARPCGNTTGFSIISGELSGKRLQLLKEVVPRVSRVAVLWYPVDSMNALQMRETETAAQALGCSFKLWRCAVPTISRGHSRPQPGRAPEPSVSWTAPSSIPTERGS
jgi:putative ABC transport system substrate-binding protein